MTTPSQPNTGGQNSGAAIYIRKVCQDHLPGLTLSIEPLYLIHALRSFLGISVLPSSTPTICDAVVVIRAFDPIILSNRQVSIQ